MKNEHDAPPRSAAKSHDDPGQTHYVGDDCAGGHREEVSVEDIRGIAPDFMNAEMAEQDYIRRLEAVARAAERLRMTRRDPRTTTAIANCAWDALDDALAALGDDR